jgi:hypothetical protein
MDDVIGQGREPERASRPPLTRHWRIAGWAMVGVVAGLAVFGLSREHGAGTPGSSRAQPTAPATWAIAQGGVLGAMATGVQAPVLAFAPAGGGPGMVCSPSTGVCSVRVSAQQVVAAPTEPAAPRATPRPALRAPGLW